MTEPRALAPATVSAHARERDRVSCPSVFASTQPGGRRMVRTLVGTKGMAALGAKPARRADALRFKGRVVCARYGPIDIGLTQFTPHTHSTPGDNFGHNHPVSRLSITLDGTQTVTVDGQEYLMTPGSGFLLPGDMPATFHASTVAARMHIDIAADHPGFMPLLEHARCGHWPPKTPLLLALSAFVGSLLQRNDSTQTWADRASIRSTLEAMVCATISTAPPFLNGVEQVLGHRQQALQYIRTHHTDPSLTPATVASGLGMSVRTLQRAFADDKSVSQWIASFRLESGLALLRDPQFAEMTLPEIAARVGFGSTVALRRGVLAATGLPPSTYRERHVGAALHARDTGALAGMYLPPAHAERS
ncbi:helix-turn-helix domain-containing protein [Xylanimonas allomyrinae]|nr:AraC family transcriptional regulator [Xylanimonas allomyrinae]